MENVQRARHTRGFYRPRLLPTFPSIISYILVVYNVRVSHMCVYFTQTHTLIRCSFSSYTTRRSTTTTWVMRACVAMCTRRICAGAWRNRALAPSKSAPDTSQPTDRPSARLNEETPIKSNLLSLLRARARERYVCVRRCAVRSPYYMARV